MHWRVRYFLVLVPLVLVCMLLSVMVITIFSKVEFTPIVLHQFQRHGLALIIGIVIGATGTTHETAKRNLKSDRLLLFSLGFFLFFVLFYYLENTVV
jgi:uncharacterized membrane protein